MVIAALHKSCSPSNCVDTKQYSPLNDFLCKHTFLCSLWICSPSICLGVILRHQQTDTQTTQMLITPFLMSSISLYFCTTFVKPCLHGSRAGGVEVKNHSVYIRYLVLYILIHLFIYTYLYLFCTFILIYLYMTTLNKTICWIRLT